jgi:hypothetical protein
MEKKLLRIFAEPFVDCIHGVVVRSAVVARRE